MFLLILESLGSTELLFILVMALVFFGPRKLPQLSRSLGKNLAEFRKASEDFKRTWEKEVNLEQFNLAEDTAIETHSIGSDILAEENSTVDHEVSASALQRPMIEAVTPEDAIARQTAGANAPPSPDTTGLASDLNNSDGTTEPLNPSSKHDWL
jgi:Tat protein translocase TatB subunit